MPNLIGGHNGLRFDAALLAMGMEQQATESGHGRPRLVKFNLGDMHVYEKPWLALMVHSHENPSLTHTTFVLTGTVTYVEFAVDGSAVAHEFHAGEFFNVPVYVEHTILSERGNASVLNVAQTAINKAAVMNSLKRSEQELEKKLAHVRGAIKAEAGGVSILDMVQVSRGFVETKLALLRTGLRVTTRYVSLRRRAKAKIDKVTARISATYAHAHRWTTEQVARVRKLFRGL